MLPSPNARFAVEHSKFSGAQIRSWIDATDSCGLIEELKLSLSDQFPPPSCKAGQPTSENIPVKPENGSGI